MSLTEIPEIWVPVLGLVAFQLFGLTHLTQVDIHLRETQPGFGWESSKVPLASIVVTS